VEHALVDEDPTTWDANPRLEELVQPGV